MIGSNNEFDEQSYKFRFRVDCELLQGCASQHRQLQKNHEVADFCPNYCSYTPTWFGQSYCRTANTYISISHSGYTAALAVLISVPPIPV
jgi:phosphopantetheinyl transferase